MWRRRDLIVGGRSRLAVEDGGMIMEGLTSVRVTYRLAGVEILAEAGFQAT